MRAAPPSTSTALDPVVQVAERQHEIGAARRRDLVPVGVELRHHDLAVERRFGLEPREQLLMVGEVLGRRRRIAVRGDVAPLRLQIGRENSM